MQRQRVKRGYNYAEGGRGGRGGATRRDGRKEGRMEEGRGGRKGGREGTYQVAGESTWLPTARYAAGRMGWVAKTVTALWW